MKRVVPNIRVALLLSAISLIGVLQLNGENLAGADASPATSTLRGVVSDSATGARLPGANVLIRDLRRGAAADSEGKFRIENVPHGSYTLVATMLGYKESVTKIVLSSNLNIQIQLVASAIELPGVDITAIPTFESLHGLGRSVTVMTERDLDKHRGQTIGSTLEQVPGVSLLQTGPSISKPVVRGLHSQRILVRNAGIPQEGQQWGGEHAPEIDPFTVSTVEILRGAAAVVHGSGAIGGVISLEPRSLKHEPHLDGEIAMNGFSNNLQGSAAVMLEGGTDWSPNLGWRVQGSVRRAGDARSPNYVIGNSGFHELNASAAVGLAGETMSSEIYFSHFGTELGIYRGAHIGNATDLLNAIKRGSPLVEYDFTYDIIPPKQKITHDLFSVRSHFNIAGLGHLEAQVGYQQNDRQEFDAHRLFNDSLAVFDRPAFELTLTTINADLKLNHSLAHSMFGMLGVSVMRQGNVRSGSVFLIPNFRSYSGGAFVLENFYTGNWSFNAGLRFDYKWIKVFRLPVKSIEERVHEYQNLSGAAGFTFSFSDKWSVGGNIGTAWRAPSINELYSNDIHHGTAQFEIGDINLKTERSLSADLTLKHQSEKARIELSVFSNTMNDFIFLSPDPVPTLTVRGAFPTFRHEQTNALLQGVDGMIEFDVTPFLRFTVSGSLVRGTTRETREPLFQMPADRIRLVSHIHLNESGIWKRPYFELSVLGVARQSRFPANVDYATPPPGYTLLNAGIGSEVLVGGIPLHIDLSVKNILNTSFRDYLSRFRYYVEDPGRDIVFRLRIPIGEYHED